MKTAPNVGLILMATLWGLLIRVHGVDLASSPSAYRGVNAWPVEGELVRIGVDPNAPPKFGQANADYVRVNAPRNIVREAKRILVGNLKTWSVLNTKDIDQAGQRIVMLADRDDKRLIFLAGRKWWMRLNEMQGLPVINKILDASARAQQNRTDYAESFMFLYKGPVRFVLSEKLWRVISSEADQWLEGRDKSIQHLAKLCGDPVIKSEGKKTLMVFNAINPSGSVERWTLFGRKGHEWTTWKVTVDTIRLRGTFSFPIVG